MNDGRHSHANTPHTSAHKVDIIVICSYSYIWMVKCAVLCLLCESSYFVIILVVHII